MVMALLANKRSITDRLLILKNLDSVLDFAKSTIQFEVIIYLGTRKKPVTVREISRELGLRLKATYDALAKLINKGLVERTRNGYALTRKGVDFIKSLYGLFSLDTSSTDLRQERLRELRLVVRNLLLVKYVYDAMVVLSNSPNYELSIVELSKILKLSKDRLKSYLDVFTDARDSQMCIFKKVVKRVDGRASDEYTYYRLTDLGLREVSKFREYRKFKRNKLRRALLTLTKSRREIDVYKKVLILLGFVTPSITIISYLIGLRIFILTWSLLVGLMVATTLAIE